MKVLELACVAEEEERRRLHSESHHHQQQQLLPMVRTVVSRKGCARAAAAAASVSSTPCLLLLLALALITHTTLSTVAAVQQEWRSNGEEEDDGGGSSNSNAHSFTSLCSGTLYPELCAHTLTGSDPNNPQTYLPAAMKAAMGTVNESLERVTELITKSPQASGTQFSVLEMCRDVLRESIAQLNTSLCRVHAPAAAAALNNKKQIKSSNVVTDIQHYVSAALTYHSTCITGIAEYGVWDGSTDLLPNSSLRVHRSIQLLSNALALVNGIVTESSDSIPSSSSSHNRRKLLVTSPSASSSSSLQHLHLHRQRRNAHVDDGDVDQELLGYFPSWLSKRDRRLLQATTTTAPNANAIVALDGSGEYTSVQAAVDAAPSKSSSRWVIYIKGGVYNENVNIAAGQTNLMFVGDGAGVTILTGSKSVAGSQVTTYYTATLGITGTGFIAKDMTIQNTAGIEGQQAVALRVSADQTAFQGLSIEGYQDTLYSHVLRQFYSQCTILGTVDFIFGNSAAVFQNCNLLAHLGAGGQQNTYTASGRTDPGQQTGFSFLSCTVDAASDLAQAGDSTPTYLGRPWKPYAVTVFINSVLGSVVNPAGWLLWNGNPNSGNNVLYGEYGNTGPGSGTSARVSWSQQLSITQAQSYTVGNFITGDSWLPATSIPFYDTL